ncbi:MAG: hypothetical protein WCG25_04620 [bacterium]
MKTSDASKITFDGTFHTITSKGRFFTELSLFVIFISDSKFRFQASKLFCNFSAV